MKTYTTQSAAGALRAKTYGAGKTGKSDAEPAASAARKVDPSVTIAPLGEMKRGAVDINSPAYTGKFKG